MNKSSFIKWARDVAVIFIGCLMIGVSFNAFFDRYGMAPGGLSGLFVVIKTMTGLELWISNLIFNVPLYILAFKLLGMEACIKTLCGIVFCSLGFKLTEPLTGITVTEIEPLACLFGGLLLGAGTGIIFKVGGSTGGTGLIGLLIGSRSIGKEISVPKIMGIADGLIVLLAAVTGGRVSIAIYSSVALLLVIVISDWIIGTYKKGRRKDELGNSSNVQ